MKRVLLTGLCAIALAAGCGDDDAGSNGDLTGSNNDGNNAGSNNAGTNNAGSNNAGSNNAGTNNAGSNNGESNNGGTNNAGSNNATNNATNNGGSNNGGTNNTGSNNATNNGGSGAVNVSINYSPTHLSVGDDLTLNFTVTGLTLSAENVGMAHVAGEGHYHVYVDTVDEARELFVGADNPLTVKFELTEDIAVGPHNVIVTVHRNDHTEFDQPLRIDLGVTVE